MTTQDIDGSHGLVPLDRTNLKVRREVNLGDLVYEGWALPGTADGDDGWQIANFTVDAENPPNILTKNFAQDTKGDETNGFIFKWTDRATLTYGA